MIRRPPSSPLFPSTPLSRSAADGREELRPRDRLLVVLEALPLRPGRHRRERLAPERLTRCRTLVREDAHREHGQDRRHDRDRSEEHTSELQPPCNLVCRLLL